MEFNTARKEIEKPSFKYFYIEEFDDDNKLFEVLSEMPNIEEYHHKKLGVNKDINKVNPELRQFYCEPLLSKQQEYHLFRKLNFFKYKAHRYYNWYCRSKLSKNKNLFVEYLKKAHDVRNLLVCCNTRLAAQVYKKRKDLYGDAVDNLLSDCFANIIRAADGFDFRRGFKFSTYCTWVLMNNSLRDYQQDKKFTDMFATNIEDIGSNETGDSEAIEKDLQQEKVISMQKDIFDIMGILSKRDQREAEVLCDYYGIKDGKKKTLKEIAEDMQITKERVRQIKNSAIEYIQALIKTGSLNCRTQDFI